MIRADRFDACGDPGECGIPVDLFERCHLVLAAAACERMVQAVGVVMDLGEVQALVAGEALVYRVRPVRLQGHALVGIDRGDEGAGGFTDAAVGVYGTVCAHG